MANYGFSTTIPYGVENFEMTGTEYCEWEDALEAAGDDFDAKEWATFDFLISKGYLVTAPKTPRPDKGKPKTTTVTVKPLVISGESREPTWTQSRILSERDKLLKERERITRLKEEALEAKIREQRWLAEQHMIQRTVDLNFYNTNGKPYTLKDWAGIIIAAFIVISLLAVVFR
jgi:hypothetical protein